MYEHVYETVDVEGSPDIRLVNSPSIVFLFSADSQSIYHFITCMSSKSLQSLPSPSQIENHPKHFFATEHQQPPRRQWLRLQPARATRIQGSSQSQSSINLCLTSRPGFSSKSIINQSLFDLLTRVVELPKTEEGLGFNVMGGKEQNSPIYISRIIPGSQLQKLSLVFRIMM